MSNETTDHVTHHVFQSKEFKQSIEVVSKVNPDWAGTITFKLPTVTDLMQSAMKQVQLRGGMAPELLDAYSNFISRACAELSVVVVDAPMWWYRIESKGAKKEQIPAPETISDIDLIVTIWEGYVAFRDTFPGSEDDQGGSQATQE